MLTEKDRVRLAPLLTRARTAKAELIAAEPEATATSGRLNEAYADADWRDRSFGGRFSREPARARAYHDARRAHADAAADLNRRKGKLARLHRQIDRCIRPMMPRIDPGYDRFATAVKQCDRAHGECRRMQQRIAKAIASAKTASEDPGRDDKAARAAERARRQYPQLITEVNSAAPTLARALDSARQAVRAAGGVDSHLRLDMAPFNQPAQFADLSARRRPVRAAPDPLQRLYRQLNHAIATMRDWRAETTAAQASAVSAARDRLIDESGP